MRAIHGIQRAENNFANVGQRAAGAFGTAVLSSFWTEYHVEVTNILGALLHRNQPNNAPEAIHEFCMSDCCSSSRRLLPLQGCQCRCNPIACSTRRSPLPPPPPRRSRGLAGKDRPRLRRRQRLLFALHSSKSTTWESSGTKGEFDTALSVIRRANTDAHADPLVLTFVHGWKNNAAPDNGNVAGFEVALQDIYARLQRNRPVIGIYIGWRGNLIRPVLAGVRSSSRTSIARQPPRAFPTPASPAP